jgi:hypothetical protein
MREPMTITIAGTFPKSLTANFRRTTYWRRQYEDSEDLKERTAFALLQQGGDPNDPENCFQTSPWPLELEWTIYYERYGEDGKLRRRFDDDNALAALKSCRDAIASFLGMSDRDFRSSPPDQVLWSKHKGAGRIVVTVTPAGYWTRVPTAWLEAEGLTPPEREAA